MYDKDFCVKPANILLPKGGIEMDKWAVIACDQFTSEPHYWQELAEFVGDSPSTLNLVLPEAYFNLNDNNKYIKKIISHMQNYSARELFTEYADSFIYVERKTPYNGHARHGIVLSIDLEHYSYIDSDKAMIRSTEGTVLSRIPPRVSIRQNALLEFPHVMLLVDDRENAVMGNIDKSKLDKLYDFDLNMGGGSISGYLIEDCDPIISALKALLNRELLMEKYGNDLPFLFAVGDGNHSLATAKAHWENIKRDLGECPHTENHPARYALAEVVNIHDPALIFEPIYRFIKTSDIAGFTEGLAKLGIPQNPQNAGIYINGNITPLALADNAAAAVYDVQKYIDGYLEKHGGEVDYIHGLDSLKKVCDSLGGVGVILPPLKKEHLFEYVVNSGSMPRKTFSMGEAQEKRYYIEGRKIVR